MVCVADVSNASEVERMVETTSERYGKLDILHNNVGGGRAGQRMSIVEVSKEDWDASMTVDLRPFRSKPQGRADRRAMTVAEGEAE